jgi:protein SCO1/2
VNRALVAFLSLISLLLISLSSAVFAAESPALKAGVFDPPRVAPEFTLHGSDGTEFKLSRYRGKVVALGFGYTSCADVCPVTLAQLAAAKKELGAAGKEFQVIYITVDPERDTAERLRKYLGAFDPTFIGGTGTPEQLAGVRKGYGITAIKKAFDGGLPGYSVHHSSFVYLIDRQGNLRGLMPFGRKIEDIVHDVKILLAK